MGAAHMIRWVAHSYGRCQSSDRRRRDAALHGDIHPVVIIVSQLRWVDTYQGIICRCFQRVYDVAVPPVLRGAAPKI
jgi:hypothetical protein